MGILKKCVAVFWSVLERQRAEINNYLHWEKVAEERVIQKILKHRAYIHYLKQMQKFLKKRLIIKTEEELLIQDKKIKKRITRENLSPNEQADIDTMAATERDIKLFFQGFSSVGALPADFALGFYSITSFF